MPDPISFPSPDDDDVVIDEVVSPEDNGSAADPVTTPEASDVETGSVGGEAESTGTPEIHNLDTNQYGTHMVTVKVDGEDVTVPLSEALGGYMRTADYTRKTQSVAEQTKQAEAFQALQQRLADNPGEVLAALQQRYGAQTGTPKAAAKEAPAGDPATSALEARIAYFEQQEQDQLLDKTLSGIAAFDPEFDRQTFVDQAVAAGMTEISQLEGFYKQQAFDKFMGTQMANTDHANASAADDAKRQAAAAAASGSVQSGGGVTAGETAPSSFDSFEEALNSAVASSGGWG